MSDPSDGPNPAEQLAAYRAKRSADRTPEPFGGEAVPPAPGGLFVVHKHAARQLHFDLRFEMDGVLKSWAVPKGPSYDPNVKRLAMMTEDHPYDYAAFEGVIPEGNYGAGNVIIWDEGEWEFLEPGDDPVHALASGKLTFRLYGKKMFGEWALVKIRGRSTTGKDNEWLLLKHRDAYANVEIDVTEVAPRSVVSNRLVDEVSRNNVWESNRKASPQKAVTIAARLAGEAPAANAKRAAKKKVKNGAARTATPARKAKAPASPSRAASAPNRSSRAGSPTKARPTPRRRPR
jgi:bifunctional non-homologous end joining protein LigD